MQQKAVRWLNALIYAAAVVGGFWLALRFVLPRTAPFILAFAVAAVLEIPVHRKDMAHAYSALRPIQNLLYLHLFPLEYFLQYDS